MNDVLHLIGRDHLVAARPLAMRGALLVLGGRG
jgi:hypothetical protein